MGYHIAWDNKDQTVVLQEYTEGASKDDLYRLAEESAQMLNTVGHTVHLIIDERRMNFHFDVTDLRNLGQQIPANQGAVVVVTQRPKQTYKAATHDLNRQITPNGIDQPYFAETLEQARQLLREHFGVRYPAQA
ncbi:MAG: hypothetical protein K8I30_12030 [Anaerolineae bacterium]|nr:hypothetical protein [Anaerolineae bacterium]